MRTSEPGDHGAVDLAGDRLHGLEVAGAGDGEARLDDVDAEARKLMRDLQLLGGVERDARRLLAVSQRGVEDDDPVVHVSVLLLGLCDLLLRAGFAASRPPRAIPPEGGGEGGAQAGDATCAGKRTSSVD